MLRALIIPLVLLGLTGCQSRYGCGPFGCGSRVPPPGTGSYGVPNTYYPTVAPRASATPTSAAPVISSNWRSVEDERSSNMDSEVSDSSPVGTSVRVASNTSAASPAPTTKSASSSIRLKGMPINEAKPAVAPASFDAPISDTGPAAVAPSLSEPPVNGLRDAPSAVGGEPWRMRPAPAPRRSVGS